MLDTVRKYVTGLFYFFWTWRIGSFWYSSYSLADMVTPTDSGMKLKGMVMVIMMVASAILHAVPLEQFPILSLASTIASVPSQIHTIIIVYQYLRPAVGNTKYSVLLYLITMLSVFETGYLIYIDCNRVMQLEYI